MSADYIDVVFSGPPSHDSGRFIEVEDSKGRSINAGDWIKRDDDTWVLRIPPAGVLNKREHFAACALQGLLSVGTPLSHDDSPGDVARVAGTRARFAVIMADALVAALDKVAT